MSFWNFLGELALLEWLFGSSKHDEVKTPPSNHLYDYNREDDYFDRIHSLGNRIDELERQQGKCDILYDELQDRIDALQDELDEMDDYSDDDL